VRLDIKGLVEIGACVAGSTDGVDDGRLEADSVTEHTPFAFRLTFLKTQRESASESVGFQKAKITISGYWQA
jgi:hypothetical protein